jgi:hypothetical protein
VRLQIGLGHLDQGQDPLGVPDEQLRRVGQPDAPAVALQQLLPCLAFQLGHLLRDRRRRHVQYVGGRADRAVPGHRVQSAQPFQIKHVAILHNGLNKNSLALNSA